MLDPNISLAVKPPQLDNPLEIYQRALTLKQLGNAQLLQQQQLQEGQQRMQLGQQQLQENTETIQQKKLQTQQAQRTAKGLQLRDQAVADSTTPEGQIDHGKVISRLQAGGYPDLAAQYATEQKTAETADLQKQQEQAKLYATHADVIGQVAIGLKQIKDPSMRAGAMQGKLPDLVKNGILTPQQAQQLQSHSPTDEELDQFIEQSGKAKEYHENLASVAKEGLDKANAEKANLEAEQIRQNLGIYPQTPADAKKQILAAFDNDQNDKRYKNYAGQIDALPKYTPKAANDLVTKARDEAHSTRQAVATAEATKPIKIEQTLATEAGKAQLAAPTGQGLDLAAEQYLTTGQLPSRNPFTNKPVLDRAAQMAKERGLTSVQVVIERASATANKEALNSLTKQNAQVEAFSDTARKNMTILQKAVDAIGGTTSPWLNQSLRTLSQKAAGDPKVSAFHAALIPAQTDIAKILNSSNATGVLSDSAAAEMRKALGEDATPAQIKAALDVFSQDMQNRKEVYAAHIEDLKGKTAVTGDKKDAGTSKATHRFNPATGKIEEIK